MALILWAIKDQALILIFFLDLNVATLALGSRPRQGVARLQTKRKEAQESKQRHGKVASQKEGSPGAEAKALEGCRPRESLGVTTHSQGFKEVRGSVRE
jgi:hypothetical protein